MEIKGKGLWFVTNCEEFLRNSVYSIQQRSELEHKAINKTIPSLDNSPEKVLEEVDLISISSNSHKEINSGGNWVFPILFSNKFI